MAVTTTTVGTVSTQVIGPSSQSSPRRKLTFHNPNLVGQQSVYFVQSPTVAVAETGIGLLPGEKYDVYGDQALTAWNAIGSGAGAKATVIEYLFGAGNLPQGYLFSLPVG
jgi:hypothetical protein